MCGAFVMLFALFELAQEANKKGVTVFVAYPYIVALVNHWS